MQNSLIRFSIKLGLPSLAIASLLGASPGLAVQASSQIAAADNDPVLMANLFDMILDANREVQRVNGTLQGGQTPPSRTRSQSPRSRQRVRTEIRQQRLDQRRQRSRDFANELQRRRAQDAAAREERRQQREAYLQSLTPEQREAFLKAERERNAAMMQMMFKGWAIMEETDAGAPKRPQSCVAPGIGLVSGHSDICDALSR